MILKFKNKEIFKNKKNKFSPSMWSQKPQAENLKVGNAPGDEQILFGIALLPSKLKCHPDFRDVKLSKDMCLQLSEILHHLVVFWHCVAYRFSSTPSCVTAESVDLLYNVIHYSAQEVLEELQNLLCGTSKADK